MYYAAPKHMKAIEAYSDSHGVSYRRLMENAGAAVAEKICRISSKTDLSEGILILCGKGNNGGDGFVTARNLYDVGLNVTVVLANGEPATELAAIEYCELSGCGINVLELNDNIEEVFRLFSSSALIVDAVYGTGFHGELPPEIKACFSYASRCKAIKLAMDVPSGTNCLSGKTAENTLKCDYTVTFGCKKIGMLSEPMRSLCGEITVADIGFTEDCFKASEGILRSFEPEDAKALFPPRAEDSYKNQFGHLLVIGGCKRMSGAAAMAVMSALRSGVGLCTLASTDEVIDRVAHSVNEATFLPLPAAPDGAISSEACKILEEEARKMSAVLIGCGLSVTEDTRKIVQTVIKAAECPVIIDADGLNCIADCIDIIRNTKCRLIITPHLGELKRLYKGAFGENQDGDRFSMAEALSREYNIVAAAKGVPNFIIGEGSSLVCKTGNPGLSRGGSGDVLAGIIAAFAAEGLAPQDAAAAGVYVHGRAADLAAKKLSVMGMLPTDVINELPFVFREWNR